MRAGIFVMIVAFAWAGVSAAGAEERPVVLKPGLGLDKVEANCGACHSLDYIQMNSPVSRCGGMECRSDEYDQGFRCAN
jgi:sulfite dehydrogenase (cytochrome) subunit B